jgi:FkbM family methyltransferase
MFALPRAMVNKVHRITTRSGVTISYRLNRGDLQGIREVWFDEVYRLPFPTPSGAFLDFGANIGLTTLWVATHCQFSRIIAIEPDHDNVAILAQNLKQNGICAEIIEAAVGPADGTVNFEKSSWSNLGHVGIDGTPIHMLCVGSLLKERGLDDVGLVKVDIEGGEQALFLGPCDWMSHVKAMIVEFHPSIVDYPLLTRTVASKGFDYLEASPKNMDCFLRTPAQSPLPQ